MKRLTTIGGLSQQEWWAANVRSEEDIVKFYKLYYPDYPDILCVSIAKRITGIVEKSRKGETLDDEERGYIERSK
jgi:hypothetical protein